MTDAPLLPPDVLEDMMAKIAAKPIAFILTGKSYHNQDGLRIEEHILVDGAFPENFPKFVAHGVVSVLLPLPPAQRLAPGEQQPKHRQPVQVPVHAETIQEAFALAPDILNKAAHEFQQQFEENLKNKSAQDSVRKRLIAGL